METTKTRDSIYNVAFKLLTLDYSVIPSGGGDKGKAPITNWKEFQYRRATFEELENWEKQRSPKLWGIVTGEISGLVVIDADTVEARQKLESEIGPPNVISPSGGAHWYVEHPGHVVKNCVGLLEGVDIRADGGFINIAGRSKKGEYRITRLPTPDILISWDKVPPQIKAVLKGNKYPAQNSNTDIIPVGQRNDRLTSLAGTMRKRGMSQGAIEAALLEENKNRCQPPLIEQEIETIAASVSRYLNNGIESTYINNTNVTEINEAKRDRNVTENVTASLAKRIEDWVVDTRGWFSTDEMDREIGITEDQAKNNRRQKLHRLREQGIIEQHQRINKQFRYINKQAVRLDYKNGNSASPLPIKWPLGIEEYVNIYPGNIVVVAGSPNAGKTAFLLNSIYKNQGAFPIYYFCSEMGVEELRARLDMFEGMDIDDWKFESYYRISEFADVIVPDCINIIDYMEMTTDLYQINTYLTDISHKLQSGIAIVAIQKKVGADLGRGQEFGLEKPKLYLTMDKDKARITKGKSWAKKTVNPNELQISFDIVDDCQFITKSRWR